MGRDNRKTNSVTDGGWMMWDSQTIFTSKDPRCLQGVLVTGLCILFFSKNLIPSRTDGIKVSWGFWSLTDNFVLTM